MSTSRKDSEDRLQNHTPKGSPAQAETGLRGEDKTRNGDGLPGRKRTNWLRLVRIKEPGAPPRSLSVWLGRLRRKKP